MSYKTNRRTRTKFQTSTEKKILEELGIKRLTAKVDKALGFYRKAHRDGTYNTPLYLMKWRELTKDFTEADWEELARRVNLA